MNSTPIPVRWGGLALMLGAPLFLLTKTRGYDLWVLVVLGVLALISGAMMFGISTLQTGVPPQWSFVPLVTGVTGLAWIFFTNSETSRGSFLVLRTLFGLGWLLLGYVLWSGEGETVQRPADAR